MTTDLKHLKSLEIERFLSEIGLWGIITISVPENVDDIFMAHESKQAVASLYVSM
jgi:hypothetical protein